MSDDFEPPDDWIVKPLGDVVRVVRDKVDPSEVPEMSYVGLEHVEANTTRLLGHGTASDVKSAKTKFLAGDVLYGKLRPYLNKVARPSFDGISSTDFLVFRESEELDNGYLAQFLNQLAVANFAHHASTGVELPRVDWKSLSKLPITFPRSKEDQQAVAAKIEEARSLSSSANAHLTSGRKAIELFRQVALSAAYRRAAGCADEPGQLVTLGSVLSEPLKNGYSARPVNHETPYRVLTLTSTTTGWFDPRHFKYTDEAFALDSPFWVQPNDILVQRGNTAEYVGVPALYHGEPGEFLYPDLMIRVRVPDNIGARFVWYMLLAPQARQFLRDRATGSAGNMPKINQRTLHSVPIPLPDSALRLTIVAELDAVLELAKQLDLRIASAARRVELSSQATLAKSLRGELFSC